MPDFSIEAIIDDVELFNLIHTYIFYMHFDSIMKILSRQTCPNYTDKPQVSVENINRAMINTAGDEIITDVHVYNGRFWSTIQPFIIDCVAQFIKGLHPDTRKNVLALYSRWCQ